MKTSKVYVVLAVVGPIICCLAASKMELEPSEHRPLLGQPNAALKDIEPLAFSFVSSTSWPEPNEAGLLLKKLRPKALSRLTEAGIEIRPELDEAIGHGSPVLKVQLDLLKLEDSAQYVFRVQTSLARMIYLRKDSSWAVKADVWMTKALMEAAPAEQTPDKIAEGVLDQIQAFIGSYQIANPKGVQPSDANAAGAASLEKRGAESPAARDMYVGSKNSKVFHRRECGWAERISPKNLVGYGSRTEATKAGKRPCRQCKP